MGFRELTLKDVEDLFPMEGNKFDILAATAQRAKQIHEAEERGLHQQITQTPTPAAKGGAESSSAVASTRRRRTPRTRRRIAPLPEEFKSAIQELARGKELTPATLVIQKGLFDTDVSSNHNRLSIPTSQIRDDFLTEEERRRLGSKKKSPIDVRILEPSGALATAKFSRWGMAKSEGKKKTSSSCYVINGKWNEIVARNNLESDMVVQLWCFRVDRDLCFALVPLPRNPAVAGDAA